MIRALVDAFSFSPLKAQKGGAEGFRILGPNDEREPHPTSSVAAHCLLGSSDVVGFVGKAARSDGRTDELRTPRHATEQLTLQEYN